MRGDLGEPNAPWYTDELRDMKRESRRLERRWISSKLEIHKQLFKEHCKKYNLAIKYAKETYHQKQFADCDSKHLFQKFDKLCTPTTSKSLPSDTSDDELANRFSHFFCARSNGLNKILSTQMNWIFLVLILTNVTPHSLIFR